MNHHSFWNTGVKYNATENIYQNYRKRTELQDIDIFYLLCSLWNLICPSGQSFLVITSKYVIFLPLCFFFSGPHSFHPGGFGFRYSVFSQKCSPVMFFFSLLHLTSFFYFPKFWALLVIREWCLCKPLQYNLAFILSPLYNRKVRIS